MAVAATHSTLSETLWPVSGERSQRLLRDTLLIALALVAMTIAAKIRVPFWPVPMTMQTFVVLGLGAAYGMRLGVLSMLGYLAVGAVGFDVFTGSSAELGGIGYMLGGTGGYLVGFVLAAAALGALARRGWDRSPLRMAMAMVIGNALIYVPGLLWLGALFAAEKGWSWVVEVGLYPFLAGDATKLLLAAALLPAIWRASR